MYSEGVSSLDELKARLALGEPSNASHTPVRKDSAPVKASISLQNVIDAPLMLDTTGTGRDYGRPEDRYQEPYG